jgi:hypothetical protein
MSAADKLCQHFRDFDLSKKETESTPFERAKKVEEMSRLVGKSMAAKFKTVRDCFRFIDEDKSGTLSRQEIQRLFKQFNYNKDFANEFFDLIDIDGSEEIDFNELRAFIGPHIQPGFQAPVRANHNIPTTIPELHEAQHQTAKNRHRTTYGDMLQGLSLSMSKNGVMQGYGGHTPRIHGDHSLLEKKSDRDVLPVFKEGLHSRLDSRRVSESSVSTAQSTANHKPAVPYSDLPVLRRLNEAALVAGALSSGVQRRASK